MLAYEDEPVGTMCVPRTLPKLQLIARATMGKKLRPKFGVRDVPLHGNKCDVQADISMRRMLQPHVAGQLVQLEQTGPIEAVHHVLNGRLSQTPVQLHIVGSRPTTVAVGAGLKVLAGEAHPLQFYVTDLHGNAISETICRKLTSKLTT